MPGCMTSTLPSSRSRIRYFALRPTDSTFRPVNFRAKPRGNGTRRSPRRCSTFWKVAPSMTGARPRRTVSTSGSSGIGEAAANPWATRADDSCKRKLGLWSAPIGAPRMNGKPAAAEGDQSERASFGFREVAAADKQRLVDDVFHKVAARYDLMNDLMSGGLHRVWKDAMVALLSPPHRSKLPFAVLDVVGGTGDIAFRIAERSESAGHK